MLRFGKLLIRKVLRERGVLTRDSSLTNGLYASRGGSGLRPSRSSMAVSEMGMASVLVIKFLTRVPFNFPFCSSLRSSPHFSFF